MRIVSSFKRAIVLVLVTTSPVLAGNDAKNAQRWAAECKAGQADSCAKLTETARTNKDWRARYQATEYLIDQAVLADIARTDNENNVQVTAVRRLTDQAILADIAKNSTNPNVRSVAATRVTDHTVLADIAKNDSNANVRTSAALQIVGETLQRAELLEIAAGHPIEAVRTVAAARWSRAEADALSKLTDAGARTERLHALASAPLAPPSAAKDGSRVAGLLARNDTRQPLAGVHLFPCSVTIQGKSITMTINYDGLAIETVTDALGRFSLAGVKKGTYNLCSQSAIFVADKTDPASNPAPLAFSVRSDDESVDLGLVLVIGGGFR